MSIAIKEYFNKEYDRYGSRTIDRFRDIPKYILENNLNGILIDVGCGKGEFIKYIDENFKEINSIGLDISIKMLAFTTNCQVILSDALHLPFREKIVNIIYMDTVLHHLISINLEESRKLQIKAMKEVKSILKKDGLLVIQELYHNFITGILSKIWFKILKILYKFGIKIPGEGKVIITLYSIQEWLQIYRENFRIIKNNVYPHKFSFKYYLSGAKDKGNIITYMILRARGTGVD